MCLRLLKDRHLEQLRTGGLGHLPDFKIKENLSRSLMGFLMYQIDPVTMTLDLGDGQKILQITIDVTEKLFALPPGFNSPPRPSNSGHDEALMKFNEELGIARNKHINTKDLRKLLEELAEDKSKDDLAMKVFGLVFYMKFICLGYSVRVSREAPMVQDFSIPELKDVDLCQLVVDELKRAVTNWQKAGAEWRAITGCCIAPLLIYLDCLDHRNFETTDQRTPRVLYMDPVNLRALIKTDLVKKGTGDPRSWIFGACPVSIVVL